MFTENDFKGAFSLAGCIIIVILAVAALVGCGLGLGAGLWAAKLLGL